MKRILPLLLLCAAAHAEVPASTNEAAAARAAVDSPAWVAKLPAATNATQLFVVAGMGMDKTTAFISMHERGGDGSWRQILSTPGFVGKNGLCADADHRGGCVAIPKDAMLRVMRSVRADCVVVIDTFEGLGASW